MSFRKLVFTLPLVLITAAMAPATASADWLFTPFIGSTFGGDAKISGSDTADKFERQLNYGASLAWMGGGVVGFEADFGYSPNFFQTDNNSGLNLVGDGNVTTLMANLVVGAPLGPVRPYASGGVGLIRSKVTDVGGFFDTASSSDLGFDAGAGVMGFFSDNIGLRGDVRFFRSLQNSDSQTLDLSLGSFKFWRGTVGVTFKF